MASLLQPLGPLNVYDSTEVQKPFRTEFFFNANAQHSTIDMTGGFQGSTDRAYQQFPAYSLYFVTTTFYLMTSIHIFPSHHDPGREGTIMTFTFRATCLPFRINFRYGRHQTCGIDLTYPHVVVY
jgi:hypothetical protein